MSEINLSKNDLCVLKSVMEAVQNNTKSFKIIVSKDGDIYHDENFKGRAAQSLESTVRLAIGKSFRRKVSTIVITNWLDNLKSKDGQSSAVMEINDSTIAYIFNYAIENKASDVYLFIRMREGKTFLEAKTYGNKLRFQELSLEKGERIASMLWTKAGGQFDRTEPCDISFTYNYKGKQYRVRVNSLPMSEGGNVIACRIRDPKEILNISDLGYSEQQEKHLLDMFNAPGGLIVFSGATNSGKSTSVTAFMHGVPMSDHMIEIADPVEAELENCAHIEINKHHVNHKQIFNSFLAALVRQNPDILVLGEIRDEQTARAAENMANQGKKVLTTLHCNSSATIFSRLVSLGMPDHVLALPYFVAGVVSQNLMSCPCGSCCIDFDKAKDLYSHKGDQHRLFKIGELFGDDVENFRFINPDSKDCSNNDCFNGVVGQTLVAEVYPLCNDLSDSLLKMIADKEYFLLSDYMLRVHECESKMTHAVGKCLSGEIDPLVCMKVIGNLSIEDQKVSISKSTDQSGGVSLDA